MVRADSPCPLQRAFQRERVHHRREDAHHVAGDARNALLRHRHAAEDIAAADDDPKLDPERMGRDEVGRDAVESRLFDAEIAGAHESFARDLDEHPTIDRLSHECSVRIAASR